MWKAYYETQILHCIFDGFLYKHIIIYNLCRASELFLNILYNFLIA
jgi:hypothetical protein